MLVCIGQVILILLIYQFNPMAPFKKLTLPVNKKLKVMKKLLIMLGFALTTLLVKAQEERSKDFDNKMGDKKVTKKINQQAAIALSLNASTKTGKDPDYSNILGGQVGIELPVAPFSKNTGLRMGGNYSMQGGKYGSSDYVPGGGSSTTSRTSRLNYINFPLMVRHQKELDGFYAEAGLQPGILVSAKDKGTTTMDIKDELKKFDVGVPVGVGYQFKNNFGVGLRVTPGLINVNKDTQYKNRNMVASFRASYSL